MDVRELTAVLGRLDFTASAPPDALARLAASAAVNRSAAGDVLFREGSLNDALMIVAEGCIALDMHVPGRGQVRILTVGPGDIVAWSALLGDGRMTTSAIVVEETQVVSISATDVRTLCESDHDFGYHFMRELGVALAERLVATRLQLLDLFADAAQAAPLDSGSDQ